MKSKKHLFSRSDSRNSQYINDPKTIPEELA